MNYTVRHFDRFVLTPIFWAFNIAGIVFLIRFHWWWMIGSVLGSFYIGLIGQKIHPLLTFSDLTQSSVSGAAVTSEEISLSETQHKLLIGQACTHLGILSGVTIYFVIVEAFDMHWYYAAILGLTCMVFIGAILKVMFKSV